MIFAVVCVFLGFLSLYIFRGKRKLKGELIRGPKGLPMIGCIFEVTRENIHFKFMGYAKQFGKIVRLKILWENIIVLNSEDMIRKAFAGEKYKRYFNDRVELFYGQHFRCNNESVGFTVDGSSLFHETARRALIQAMQVYGSGIRDSEKKVMKEMTDVLERIENSSRKEFECVDLFQRSLSNIISLVLSGEPISDADPDVNMFWEHAKGADFFINSYVNTVMRQCPFIRFLPGKYGDAFRHAKKTQTKIAERYFYDIKKTHFSGEIRGIVDYYIEEQRKQIASGSQVVFTDERIIAQMYETVDPGVVVTGTALTNAMLVLLNYPEYQTKIQAELDREIGRDRQPSVSDMEKCTFLKVFEMELHRYITDIPLLLPYLCREHIEFDGYDIEPNSTVIANVWYLHHNEDIWGDPWNFRPDRFLDEQGNMLPEDHTLCTNIMPFGYGQRQCTVEDVAKTHFFLYIATLLQRWRFEFPPGKQTPCDPRLTENFDIKLTLRAKPFLCCATERT